MVSARRRKPERDRQRRGQAARVVPAALRNVQRLPRPQHARPPLDRPKARESGERGPFGVDARSVGHALTRVHARVIVVAVADADADALDGADARRVAEDHELLAEQLAQHVLVPVEMQRGDGALGAQPDARLLRRGHWRGVADEA